MSMLDINSPKNYLFLNKHFEATPNIIWKCIIGINPSKCFLHDEAGTGARHGDTIDFAFSKQNSSICMKN